MGWFPPVAALVAFVWYALQIYESKTVQEWAHNRRTRKIAELRVRMAALEALEKKSEARRMNRTD